MIFGAIGELAIGELSGAVDNNVYPHEMVVATVLDPVAYGLQIHILPGDISSSSTIDAVDVSVWNVSPQDLFVASDIDAVSVSVSRLFSPEDISASSFIDLVVITVHSPGRTFGPAIQ